MSDTTSPEIRDAPDAHRYEIAVDGEVAGFAVYQRRGGRTYFVHTEIDTRFEGRGLGSTLAKAALDAERDRGEPIIPLCPFIRRYIERHPEYADLVDTELLARIDGT